MGMQKKTTQTTVVAELTDLGKYYLLVEPSMFEVTQFAVFDDEVSYELWNPTHPNGTDFYGKAIENTKVLEPVSSAHYQAMYPLIRDFDRTVNRYPVVVQQGDVSNGLVTLSNLEDNAMINLKTENYTAHGWIVTVSNENIAIIGDKNGNRNLPAGWEKRKIKGLQDSVGVGNPAFTTEAEYHVKNMSELNFSVNPGFNNETKNKIAKITCTETSTHVKTTIIVSVAQNNTQTITNSKTTI